MTEDWKNPTCKKCGKKYRIQDIHKCEDELLDFLKGFNNKKK